MLDKDTTPTPKNPTTSLPPGAKYRGAVVEDLQLPPAFCLPSDAHLGQAMDAAYEREFDQLPVLNHSRKPIGYLYMPHVKEKFSKGEARPNDPISRHLTHFPLSSKSHPYTVITPDTPLEELEEFFVRSSTDFALVTDYERKWVLAVVSKSDLEVQTSTLVKVRIWTPELYYFTPHMTHET